MADLFWNGGRLEGTLDDSTVSMSVTEADIRIPKDKRIAKACVGPNPKKPILKPYDYDVIRHIRYVIKKENE